MDNITLTAFLLWLLTGPGVGAALAWAGEYLPYFATWLQGLSYDGKRLVVMLLALVIPLGAAGLRVWLGYVPSTPDLWFAAASAGFLGYMTSQLVHLRVRQSEPAT